MGGFFSKIFGKVSNEGKPLFGVVIRFNFESYLHCLCVFNRDFLTEAAKILNTFRERYTELLKTKPDARSNEVNLIESFE